MRVSSRDMTATGDAPQQPSLPDDGRGRFGRHRGAAAVLEVCPYVAASDGRWRSAYPTREHRCGALRPPAALAVAKQREICLGAAHRACATYLAAQALEADARAGAPGDEGAGLWSPARTTPLVLDPRRRLGPISASPTRGGGQALLVGLMVVAFLFLVIARTTAPGGPGAGASGPGSSLVAGGPMADVAPSLAPTPVATASEAPATQTARPTVSPSAALPSPTPGASPTASPTPAASAARRYKVKSGDTLSGIAARFGVTVRALRAANDIEDPTLIRAGQVLIIP